MKTDAHNSLDKLKNFLLDECKDIQVKIILFGSRARGDYHTTSDIDIGFMPRQGFDSKKIMLIKEKVEDLNIPYEIDFLNFNEVDKSLQKELLKDAIIWKD